MLWDSVQAFISDPEQGTKLGSGIQNSLKFTVDWAIYIKCIVYKSFARVK